MKRDNTLVSNGLVAMLFLALSIGALYVFVTAAEPTERQPGAKFKRNYATEALDGYANAARLQHYLRQIEEAGTPRPDDPYQAVGRYTGTPGFYRTESLITDAFTRAGLQVTTQEFEVVVPRTVYCEVLDAQGQPLPGVQLFPFEPNGLLPAALPAEGLSGSALVVNATEVLDLLEEPVEGSILITRGMNRTKWSEAAALGAKAVIVTEAPTDASLPDSPANWIGQVTGYDVPFPHFLARGPIHQYDGQALTLRSKVVWETVKARNVIGVLRAAKQSREALVINSYYDSASVVPDLAPGAEQALSLASMLSLVDGMAPYADSMHRDVVFVATAGHGQTMAGTYRLMEAIETFTKDLSSYQPPAVVQREHEEKLTFAKRALEVIADDAAWSETDGTAYQAQWRKESPAFRSWFENCFTTVAGEINLARRDDYLQQRVTWVRAGRPTYREGFDATKASDIARKDPANNHPLMTTYIAAKDMENRAGEFMSMPFYKIAAQSKSRGHNDFQAWGYRERVRDYFTRILNYHEQQLRELRDDTSVRELFARYDATLTINLELYSGGQAPTPEIRLETATPESRGLAVLVGIAAPGPTVEPQSTEVRTALDAEVPLAAEGNAKLFPVQNWGTSDALGLPLVNSQEALMESMLWFRCARLAYSITNLGFFPAKLGTPEDLFGTMATDVVGAQLNPIGRTMLAMAHGRVAFKSLSYSPGYFPLKTLRGTVYASAGNASLIPNHRMAANTVVRAYYAGPPQQRVGAMTPPEATKISSSRGIRVFPILPVNPYGEFSQKFMLNLEAGTFDAARFGDDGQLIFYKDMGSAGQSVYRNEFIPPNELTVGNEKAVNIALFRCTPVSCFQRSNPQTLASFAGFDFLTNQGLATPEKYHIVDDPNAPGVTAFLSPDEMFYVAIRGGSVNNPDVQSYRAFMLNVDTDESISTDESDVYGKGYLAADTQNLTFPYIDAAESVLRTNEKRLRLQEQYQMADAQMIDSHSGAKQRLDEAKAFLAEGDVIRAANQAGRSLAMAMNNHPVIRGKISSAVYGIIWYLVLLVPFAVFFEKLVFGFADIRKQLLAHGIIIVLVFVLLRLFHPAFQMVSNPFVILLGFLIFLLSVLVTMMMVSKFQQNLTELRRRQGQVEGADINRGGVVGTAFMLGLNNMRRRKVRTGLTCVTLVLITFVMICFTSVSTGLQDVEYATGRYPSNGFMLRDQNFQPIPDDQASSIKQIYGLRYPVSEHKWVVQTVAPETMMNLKIKVDRQFTMGTINLSKSHEVGATITMPWNEPQFSGIDKALLTNRGWFPKPPETEEEAAAAAARGEVQQRYVILPSSIATALSLSVEDVNTGHQKIKVQDQEYEVLGIIDADKLNNMVGMDGRSILPYDLASGAKVSKTPDGLKNVLAPNTARLKAGQVLITNDVLAGIGQPMTAAVSVMFPRESYQLRADMPVEEGLDYRGQRAEINEYLERVGTSAFYTIDGISYYGSRTRTKTVEGLIALLIPILIAAMTVFNTMRGSVYERRDEIFVYNAVGIAPNHIFFMFMAEACVYAVIGAVMGYLVSQITGTVLTMANLTGGLNMDYSSIETIYASIAIVISVMVSTIIPARAAARMASPSEEANWTVPTVENDAMKFNLPFTFTPHDRLAIISYFHRWLDAYGEGSSGQFFSSSPEIHVESREEEPNNSGLVPVIAATIWLKPYDLGVSQRVTIALPTDPETGEYIANITIERLSGTTSAWSRTMMPFLTALRKQFLNWRAVSDAERTEMFDEAKQLMMTTIKDEEVTTNV